MAEVAFVYVGSAGRSNATARVSLDDPHTRAGSLATLHDDCEELTEFTNDVHWYKFGELIGDRLTKDSIADYLEGFFDKVDRAGVLYKTYIVCYGGHGDRRGDWVTSASPFTLTDLATKWKASDAGKAGRQLVVVADSCYSGVWARPRPLANLFGDADVCIQAACEEGEKAYERDGRGLFTKTWVQCQRQVMNTHDTRRVSTTDVRELRRIYFEAVNWVETTFHKSQRWCACRRDWSKKVVTTFNDRTFSKMTRAEADDAVDAARLWGQVMSTRLVQNSNRSKMLVVFWHALFGVYRMYEVTVDTSTGALRFDPHLERDGSHDWFWRMGAAHLAVEKAIVACGGETRGFVDLYE